MNAQNFTTTLLLDQTPQEVFEAINDVNDWWHGEITGPTHAVGDEFTYRMKDLHYSKQKVTELVPNQKVEWLITDSKLSFTENQNEWTGTKVLFELEEVDGKTRLRFSHIGLKPECECYNACSNGWTMLIHESLPSLLISGKGKPVFE